MSLTPKPMGTLSGDSAVQSGLSRQASLQPMVSLRLCPIMAQRSGTNSIAEQSSAISSDSSMSEAMLAAEEQAEHEDRDAAVCALCPSRPGFRHGAHVLEHCRQHKQLLHPTRPCSTVGEASSRPESTSGQAHAQPRRAFTRMQCKDDLGLYAALQAAESSATPALQQQRKSLQLDVFKRARDDQDGAECLPVRSGGHTDFVHAVRIDQRREERVTGDDIFVAELRIDESMRQLLQKHSADELFVCQQQGDSQTPSPAARISPAHLLTRDERLELEDHAQCAPKPSIEQYADT